METASNLKWSFERKWLFWCVLWPVSIRHELESTTLFWKDQKPTLGLNLPHLCPCWSSLWTQQLLSGLAIPLQKRAGAVSLSGGDWEFRGFLESASLLPIKNSLNSSMRNWHVLKCPAKGSEAGLLLFEDCALIAQILFSISLQSFSTYLYTR